MASPVYGNPELGRTSDRPNFFCARTGPECRSKFDPHLLLAQSKELDETITKTLSSDRDSNILDLDLPHKVDGEHHAESSCNKSNRHTFNATSSDDEILKMSTMTQSKGNITAVNSGPRDDHTLDQVIEIDINIYQNPFTLNIDYQNQIYHDCCFEKLKLQYEANGLDFSKVYSEDFSIHCIDNTLDPLDMISKPIRTEFKWNMPPNAQLRVDYNAQLRVPKCSAPDIH